MKRVILIALVFLFISSNASACILGKVHTITTIGSTGVVSLAMKKVNGNTTASYPLQGTGDALKSFVANVMTAQARNANVCMSISAGNWTKIIVY